MPRLFLRFSMFTLIAVFSNTLFADKQATEDWSRRDAFVKPEDLNEPVVASWEGGLWKDKGLYGTFRFIITEYKKGKEKLYVQWLDKQGAISYSLSVKELNVRPEYDLELPECEGEGMHCVSIKVPAKHYYEETEREFTIILERVGKYAFQM